MIQNGKNYMFGKMMEGLINSVESSVEVKVDGNENENEVYPKVCALISWNCQETLLNL